MTIRKYTEQSDVLSKEIEQKAEASIHLECLEPLIPNRHSNLLTALLDNGVVDVKKAKSNDPLL